MGHIWAKKSDLGHFSLQCELSLMGRVPTYSAVVLWASRVQITARGPSPIPPTLSLISLPATSTLSYANKVKKKCQNINLEKLKNLSNLGVFSEGMPGFVYPSNSISNTQHHIAICNPFYFYNVFNFEVKQKENKSRAVEWMGS